ncbi:amino acid adenylation domain-containing protein [Variovorax sp.]|uniref:amino acid adenylation domain-containing protein n=1 Tax=Variovorax sp. TaxID=1871043 RepID=UPI00137D1A74|nr:amino acid adenylation domain-containing protein [Variovorax sp.]KAF1073183.1 MAG: Linear gramicidin synthase subunit B [Variovorax sp.]
MSTSRKLSDRRAGLTPAQQALLASRLKGLPASEAREPALVPSTDAADRAMLSFAQRRQWFLWKLDPASTAYHIAEGLRLEGALDVDALRTAFQALVARHESLRTVFRAGDDGLAEQVVLPSLVLEIPLVDLSGAPEALRAGLAGEAARSVSREPFDLLRGPLLRLSVIRESEQAHVLVVVMHHIVSDGWSMQILVDEFVAQYRAIAEGDVAPGLPPLPVQYADYAAWQRRWLEAGERERQLAYWREQLGAEQPVLQLPVDHPRKSEGGYVAASHVVELPAALAQALRRQTQERGTTPFMLLLAAFQALLHRYTGQEDIRVGVPVANRNRAETEGVIGFFVNTQVLRARVHGRMPFAQLLAGVREAALGAQAHQDLPFEQLVEALQPERSMGHSPLFQVMFNYLRGGYEALRTLPGLRMEGCPLGEKAAQFELTLTAIEDSKGGIKAVFGYARELFEPGTVVRMAGHYLALLQALADAPGQAVGDVPLHDEPVRPGAPQRGLNVLRFANAQPVHRLIEQQVRSNPEAGALVCGAESLTYAQLNERANRLAHRLIASGAGPETQVGIVMERNAGMVASVLAVLKSGAAYVPLDPEHPQDRLAYMASDSGLSLLLTQDSLRARIAADAAFRVLSVDALDLSNEPVHDPDVPLHAEHLAYVIYTSGSTGKPKGVMVRHEALSHFIRSMQAAPGMTQKDVLVAVTSLSFDIAALELYLPLSCGARIVLASQETVRDGRALARLVEDSGATVVQSTPAGWRLLRVAGWPSAPLRGFKGLCGGETLQPDLADDLHGLGVELWNMYGPTETTIWSSAQRVAHGHPGIGEAIAATQLRVLDAGLRPVPRGVAGELYIGGVGLARGYLHRAGLSAERFLADPFDETGGRLYRTGDLVRWSVDGRLHYLSRVDHQIKIRGFRIELGEVEAQLLAQPEVREAVAVAKEGAGGARLLAYVSPRSGQDVDAAGLRMRLAQVLPEYMVPAAIAVLPALPLNVNGKVDRKQLPELAQGTQQVYEAPQGDVEQALAAIWAQVLGLDRVGRHDSFFDLGGHSLLAVQMVARVQSAMRADIAIQDVFRHPVLKDMASRTGASALQGGADDALSAVDSFIDSLGEV